jgi:hypothetical protein
MRGVISNINVMKAMRIHKQRLVILNNDYFQITSSGLFDD